MDALVNLTPHPVNVLGADGALLLRLPASPTPARVAVERTSAESVEGVLVVVETLGRADLPAPQPGVRLIVSTVVARTEWWWGAGRWRASTEA